MYSQYHLQPQPQANPYQPQVAPPPSDSPYRSDSHSMPSSPETSHSTPPRPQPGPDSIGRPIEFSSGPYKGMTIRMELHEIQSANLGRKYARVDRRPLDPPPVVHLKMFEVLEDSANRRFEQEMVYNDIQILGLLCTLDLFPVPALETFRSTGRDHSNGIVSAPSARSSFLASPSPSSSSSVYSREVNRYNYSHQPSANTTLGSPPRSQNHRSGVSMPPTDVVYNWHGFPITESSKETQALVGATFVQPTIIDYQGSKAIVFVFADLAVKIEGTFILRYRVFDIFARRTTQCSDLAITAECYGGLFRVYSTKEFPGLSVSTELTKLLARWGVRLNIRETERRRPKRSASSSGRRSPTPD